MTSLGTGTVVTFDYAGFQARYPEFGSVTMTTAQTYFAEACLYLDNTGGSAVQDLPTRSTLLNMIVAHIAALAARAGLNVPGGVVGPISSATTGSVSVAIATPALGGTAAYFAQTPYGLSYWTASAGYRRFRYVPGRRPGFGPGFRPWP